MKIISVNTSANEVNHKGKRVPAEFEPKEAIWMQWPSYWEKDYEKTFAKMADIICRYGKLHILYHSDQVYEDAQKVISETEADPQNKNTQWHAIPYDNAWIRDNGPIYFINENELRIQNWEFNA